MDKRKYPDLATKLRDDEVAMQTVWQAHTVRHGCQDGSCEARTILEDAIGKIQDLIKGQGP